MGQAFVRTSFKLSPRILKNTIFGAGGGMVDSRVVFGIATKSETTIGDIFS